MYFLLLLMLMLMRIDDDFVLCISWHTNFTTTHHTYTHTNKNPHLQKHTNTHTYPPTRTKTQSRARRSVHVLGCEWRWHACILHVHTKEHKGMQLQPHTKQHSKSMSITLQQTRTCGQPPFRLSSSNAFEKVNTHPRSAHKLVPYDGMLTYVIHHDARTQTREARRATPHAKAGGKLSMMPSVQNDHKH